MQEFSMPVIYVVKPDDNVTDDVFANAENWPDAAGFKRKVKGTWTPASSAGAAWPTSHCV